jgi:hypothetical protein
MDDLAEYRLKDSYALKIRGADTKFQAKKRPQVKDYLGRLKSVQHDI